jgi:P pilus assembly/Cpx signaling pathway, periplasmic inhibitor/zinc-resistance associated protein
MNRKNAFWIALWVVLVVITGYFAFFHSPWRMGYGPWHGWGGGWSDENDYPAYRSPGWRGMAPGWGSGWQGDDGWGRSYGMMGPYGGMPGMGFGMPGYGTMPGALPELTPAQSRQLAQLQAEQFERSRALIQQMWQAQARLNELYAADKRDWDAIRDATQKIFELQRQQHESALELQRKIDGVLTDAQRQALARSQRGYGWMGRQ